MHDGCHNGTQSSLSVEANSRTKRKGLAGRRGEGGRGSPQPPARSFIHASARSLCLTRMHTRIPCLLGPERGSGPVRSLGAEPPVSGLSPERKAQIRAASLWFHVYPFVVPFLPPPPKKKCSTEVSSSPGPEVHPEFRMNPD